MKGALRVIYRLRASGETPKPPSERERKQVAIYHVNMKAYRRSKGHSSTAAAAYRSGTKIVDERTGVVHDYTRKGGVAFTKLLLPGGRKEDRADLWNRIERHHKRGDAVVSREIEMSLPHELQAEKRQELALEFAEYFCEKYGVAVDCAFHEPGKNSDERNHHVHLHVSACSVDIDGKLGKKVEVLDPIHCQKRHGMENVAEVERPVWEKMLNTALANANIDERVDHRSLKDQGVTDRLPGRHMGPAATAIERRGEISERGEEIHAEQVVFVEAIDTQEVWERRIEGEAAISTLEAELLQVEMALEGYDEAAEYKQIRQEIIEEEDRRKAEKEERAAEEEEKKDAHLVLIAPAPTALLSMLAPGLFDGFSMRSLKRRRDGEEYQKIERRNDKGKVVESVAVFKDEIRLYEHEDLRASVARMIALALQRGWSLKTLKVEGSDRFANEARRQIAAMQAAQGDMQISDHGIIEFDANKFKADRRAVDAAIDAEKNVVEQDFMPNRPQQPEAAPDFDFEENGPDPQSLMPEAI